MIRREQKIHGGRIMEKKYLDELKQIRASLVREVISEVKSKINPNASYSGAYIQNILQDTENALVGKRTD